MAIEFASISIVTTTGIFYAFLRRIPLLPIAALLLVAPAAQALTVTRPAAAELVAAGDDYATQVLGNAWDANDAVDIDAEESQAIANQTFGSGIFSGDTVTNGAYFYPLFAGYPQTVNLSRGANFPIDTSRYRYVTIKMRATQPSGQPQFARVIFLQDGTSYSAGTYGLSIYSTLLVNQWQIIRLDMVTQLDPTSPHTWTSFPQVEGLRVDPATTNAGGTYASAHFDVDWIRLTAPATAAQKYTVQWTDSGSSGPYVITAIDSGGVPFQLGSGISGTSYAADMTVLPPGQYTISVARSGATATSGVFSINNPPQIAMTAPSARGEQALNFAQTVVGNPWGPIQASDLTPVNFASAVYNNPVNSFYGRPANQDPQWFLNLGGHTIDTSLYRSLCFKMEVFGPRSLDAITGGSIARVFWGNNAGSLSTSQDIVLDDNLSDTLVSEYCIPDLVAVPLVETIPPGGIWSGSKAVLRLDPDEFTPPAGCSTPDTCHDVRLDSVILSPFAQANPGYTFQWALTDTDNASDTVTIYLDRDKNPNNGNEMPIHTAVASTGSGSYAWPGSNSVTYGTYNVLVVADDGMNNVSQYAGGPLVVGARDGIFRNGFDIP